MGLGLGNKDSTFRLYTLASTTFVPAASAATTFGAEGRSPMDAIRPSEPNYLRSPITKQCIKFLIKADFINESVLS